MYQTASRLRVYEVRRGHAIKAAKVQMMKSPCKSQRGLERSIIPCSSYKLIHSLCIWGSGSLVQPFFIENSMSNFWSDKYEHALSRHDPAWLVQT